MYRIARRVPASLPSFTMVFAATKRLVITAEEHGFQGFDFLYTFLTEACPPQIAASNNPDVSTWRQAPGIVTSYGYAPNGDIVFQFAQSFAGHVVLKPLTALARRLS